MNRLPQSTLDDYEHSTVIFAPCGSCGLPTWVARVTGRDPDDIFAKAFSNDFALCPDCESLPNPF